MNQELEQIYPGEQPPVNENALLENAPTLYPNYTDFRIETYVGSSTTETPSYDINEELGEVIIADENGKPIEFFGSKMPDQVEHKVLIGKPRPETTG
jgi:hypothetical protein